MLSIWIRPPEIIPFYLSDHPQTLLYEQFSYQNKSPLPSHLRSTGWSNCGIKFRVFSEVKNAKMMRHIFVCIFDRHLFTPHSCVCVRKCRKAARAAHQSCLKSLKQKHPGYERTQFHIHKQNKQPRTVKLTSSNLLQTVAPTSCLTPLVSAGARLMSACFSAGARRENVPGRMRRSWGCWTAAGRCWWTRLKCPESWMLWITCCPITTLPWHASSPCYLFQRVTGELKQPMWQQKGEGSTSEMSKGRLLFVKH